MGFGESQNEVRVGHILLFGLPFDGLAKLDQLLANGEDQRGVWLGRVRTFFLGGDLLDFQQVFLGLHPTGQPEFMIRLKQVNPADLAEIEPDRVIC